MCSQIIQRILRLSYPFLILGIALGSWSAAKSQNTLLFHPPVNGFEVLDSDAVTVATACQKKKIPLSRVDLQVTCDH